jgi:UDP-N-acetyl-D-mannosaminuronate dehydrogenase
MLIDEVKLIHQQDDFRIEYYYQVNIMLINEVKLILSKMTLELSIIIK